MPIVKLNSGDIQRIDFDPDHIANLIQQGHQVEPDGDTPEHIRRQQNDAVLAALNQVPYSPSLTGQKFPPITDFGQNAPPNMSNLLPYPATPGGGL